MRDDTREQQAPWVCLGYTEDHEDELIGNRDGFLALRNMIDDVLETGHARVEEPGIDWIGLRLVADDPRKKKLVSQPRDALNLLMVASVVAVILFVFFVGVMSIYSWFK